MPKPMHEKIAAAYQNIKNITGLEFDEYNLDEVKKAFSKIYISGRGLFAGDRFNDMKSVNDSIVVGVNDTLNSVLSTKTVLFDFISIINPNDPYAVPKVLYQDTPRGNNGKVIENPTEADLRMVEARNAQGRAYEKDFLKNHKKNLIRLGKELENYTMPDSEYLDASYYFASEQLDKRTGGFQNQSDIWEFSNTENAIQFCNLVLLGRGYTQQELLSKDEDVMEAKRLVGAELTGIMSSDLSNAERSRRFHGLVKDAMEALNGFSFRTVDLSDDNTLENVKYNQWIANMAENLGQVLKGARQTFRSRWISDTEKDLDLIRNFTSGITAVDCERLKGINGELRNAESMRKPALAQMLVNNAGMSYTKYHNTGFEIAKSEMNLATLLTGTMQDQIRGNAEYEDAFRRDRKAKTTEMYQKFVEADLQRQGNVPVERLKEDMTRAASIKAEDLEYSGRIFAWADADPGVTIQSMGAELRELIRVGVASQVSRQCTMEAMFLAYGLMKAEQSGQKLSIREFYNNAELQKKTGKEAMQFFRDHPMPAGTEELTKENYKAFSEMMAALNRGLADTVLLNYDYTNPEKMEADRDYIRRLHGLLCDSHQLRDIIPEDSSDIFYAAHGGRDNYENLQKQITLAEAMTASLTKLIPERELDTRSLNRLFEPEKADAACRGLYILKQSKQFRGKKIGEFPADNTGKRLWLTMFNAAPLMLAGFQEKSHDVSGKRAIREYLRSYGKNDAVGIEELIEDSAKIVFMGEADLQEENVQAKEQEEEQEVLPKEREDSVVAMEDPGDNLEGLAHAPKAEPAAGKKHAGPDVAEHAGDVEEPGAEDLLEETNGISEGGTYDWSAELSPAQWKKRLENFYTEIDAHDPAWLRSSEEFRDVKHNLKKALDMLGDKSYNREAFNSRMEKLFRRAGDYIDKKSTGSVGKHYGKERLTTITELRELLAGRNKNPLDLDGAADIFGGKVARPVQGEEKIVEDTAARQEKLERGMMRLGIYLASAEDDTPEKVKGKMELVERVIAERGKNPETRNRLMNEMARITTYGNTGELMEQAKDRIIDRMLSQNRLDAQAAGWGRILKALQTTAQNTQSPAIRKAVNAKEVDNYLRLGRFADKAQDVRNKILDSEQADSLSREEAGAIVTTATISSFMKQNTGENRLMSYFNSFIQGKTDEQLLEHFAASPESQKLQTLHTNQELKKQAAGAMAQELIGLAGAKQICQLMIAREKGEQGKAPARENSMDKQAMMPG